MEEKTFYDLIILGAGPAGLTAGIYAARKQIDTLIISSDIGGQTSWSSGIENYLGFVFIPGTELVQKFEEHLRTFDIKIEYDKALRVTQDGNIFNIETEAGRKYMCRALIVATGKSPKMLDVPGEKEFVGRGVTYCATCDGPLFSGMDVAVIGGGNSGLDAVAQLMKICPKVYLVEIAKELRADEIIQKVVKSSSNVEIMTRTAVKEIRGDQFVSSIIVENVDTNEIREIPVKGVFIEVGLVPNTDFIKDLVQLNHYGEIAVDCAGRTGIPGLYAAGDVTNVPEKQIIIAAGDGAKAALGAYSYLLRQPYPEDWSKKASIVD